MCACAKSPRDVKPAYGRGSKKGSLEDNRELFEFYAGGADGEASAYTGSTWGESDDPAMRRSKNAI